MMMMMMMMMVMVMVMVMPCLDNSFPIAARSAADEPYKRKPSSGELRLLDNARFKAVTGGSTGTPPFCHTRSVFAFIGMLPVLPWWAGCTLASLLCSCSAPGTIGSP
uniref:Secreted protein n=1 Tax=Anopheles farauti TaxID=69004 RepID=A0A182Q8Z7_9DIPT